MSVDSENEALRGILEKWGSQPMVREAALQQEMNEEDMHAEVCCIFYFSHEEQLRILVSLRTRL